MATVSNIVNNNVAKPINTGKTNSETNSKSYVSQTLQSPNTKSKKEQNKNYKEDTIVSNGFLNKMKINVEKTADIPFVHFPRGLGGAPDFTFFEFLQTAKFPYYVGGPILAALFYAGVKKDNLKSAQAAKHVAKRMAVGVALYYVGAMVAKSIINTTTKVLRGVDLNQPYVKAISTDTNNTGAFKKSKEYHKLFESIDFTRTDMLYRKGKTPDEINATYKRYGKKYGVKDDTNDVDSTVKPLLKKTIVMARAWQYALTAFYVTLGIGMANQSAWNVDGGYGFKDTVKDIFAHNKPMKERLHNAKIAAYDYVLKPFGQSFKEFWHGQNKTTSIVGKSVILSTLAATVLGISLIATKTSAKNQRIVKQENPKNNEVKQ